MKSETEGRGLWRRIVDKYYPAGTPLRDIYLSHCSAVVAKALALAHDCALTIPDDQIVNAAMLHDIGIFLTDAPSICCHGREPYIRHGILGAELLRREGYPEEYARVAELHTGAGLTAAEIEAENLPLPRRDFLPETELERLICYADKFFSKGGDRREKTLEQARASVARHSADAGQRFDRLAAEFASLGSPPAP
ncbi:MAG: HDIG domain-containing protein [Clostridium sp.]|nr:HDIG domain-containing protein [Clostridium sp.]